MDTDKELVDLFEKYRRLLGNVQVEAAASMVLAHVIKQALQAKKKK